MAEGYKDWSAGDILTAADLEDYTVKQSVMRFADSSARTTALSGVLAEGMMSYLKDTDTVEVYDGSAWAAVAGGKILQVVHATYSTQEDTTSATFVATSLTANITPSDSANKVLAFAYVPMSVFDAASSRSGYAQYEIDRGGTSVTATYNIGYGGTGTENRRFSTVTTLFALDSPASTSAVTYTINHRYSTNGTVNTFYGNATGHLVLMEVSA